ncbi:hypothetical protein B1813_14270 [Saccharomonospora piscinae]|uniref:DUF3566 domain-containing protein n=1 Tax=Saccharomonospora piscinae TaxID=687388 RepID=A0A1V9A0X1_SACPI|nr:DUF3566 domain-containing protein [Saccharomonospora piscinae]OQO90710.1 hypothetical protein B1813_14270 [Saccharomonospora piscinae]
MTPPDNTEHHGSGGTDTTTGEVPPWQRVAKEDSADSPDGDGSATQWLTGPPAGGDQNAAGSVPPEQGGAANRLFGGQGEQDTTRPVQQPRGTAAQGAGSAQSLSAFRRPGRGPRRANLQVKRVDPWSVLKLSLVLGVALFFIWLVAVGVLYTVLDGMGVWDNINGTYNSLVADDGAGGEVLITAGTVFGAAAIVGAVNIVLISALTTVGAFVYNVCAGLAGGLELTLSERE